MWFLSEEKIFKKKIEREYPECKDCPFLTIENTNNNKVRCFYRPKDRCILER